MPPEMPQVLFVQTTVANADDAQRLAEHVIRSRAAACVQIGAPVTSVFRWDSESEDASQARVQTEREIPIVIKTTARAYADLERCIREIHPYTLPEIVAIPVERGLPAFLEWVEEVTRTDR